MKLIDYLDANIITPKIFYKKYFMNKIPVVIKNSDLNFSNKLNFIINNEDKLLKNMYISTYWELSYSKKYDNLISNYIKDALISRKDFNKRKSFRIWKQKYDTLTSTHYDTCDLDLVYFVLKGEKQFYLKNPNSSIEHLPFINWELKKPWSNYEKDAISIKLYPGDMLYLPRHWYHQVRTLKEDTISISFTGIDLNKNSKLINTTRNDELNLIYSKFNKNYYNECIFNKDYTKYKYKNYIIFKRIIIEVFQSFSLNLLLIFIALNIAFPNKYLFIFTFILFYYLLYFYNKKNFNIIFSYFTSKRKNEKNSNKRSYISSKELIIIMIVIYVITVFILVKFIKFIAKQNILQNTLNKLSKN